jgi:hypothetical protein
MVDDCADYALFNPSHVLVVSCFGKYDATDRVLLDRALPQLKALAGPDVDVSRALSKNGVFELLSRRCFAAMDPNLCFYDCMLRCHRSFCEYKRLWAFNQPSLVLPSDSKAAPAVVQQLPLSVSPCLSPTVAESKLSSVHYPAPRDWKHASANSETTQLLSTHSPCSTPQSGDCDEKVKHAQRLNACTSTTFSAQGTRVDMQDRVVCDDSS